MKIDDKTSHNSPSLRFPEFTGEWKNTTLEECVDFLDGQRKPIKSDDRKGEKRLYPYYGASGIIDYIDEYIFDGDYILLSEDGANIIDRNYRVAFIANGKIWVNNHAHVLQPHKEMNINFLSEALERINYAIYNTGTTMPKLNQEICRKINLNVPSLSEQNKIGNLLYLLNERIATQNRLIEDLKKLRCAIVEKMFKQSKANGRLGDFIEQVSVRNKNGLYSNVLSVSNKQGFVKQSEQFEDRTVASEDTSNYKIVKRNNFAYNPARINVGSIARLTKFDVGIVSPMYVCFRTKASIIPEYMEAFFTSQQFFYEMMKRLEGSVRLCLSYEGLCNIPVYIPDMNKQIAMGQNISLILSKIGLEIEYLGRLHQQKQYLLRKMFI
jgi:type I restriction enzyme S subunit